MVSKVRKKITKFSFNIFRLIFILPRFFCVSLPQFKIPSNGAPSALDVATGPGC